MNLYFLLAQAPTPPAAAPAAAPSPFPLVHGLHWQALIIIAAFLLTLSMSGKMIQWFVLPKRKPEPARDPMHIDPERHEREERERVGRLIGKCENILILTMILLGEFTGIGLVFTAKALARSEDIKKDAGYFLGGTLVNLVWTMAVALLAKMLAIG